MVNPGVLPDLPSGIKKCPNLFRLCGFAIRSKGVCFTLCWGIVNPRFSYVELFFTAAFKSAGTPGGGALLTPPFFSGVNRLTVNRCFLHRHPDIIHCTLLTISSASPSSSAPPAVRFALSLADRSRCLQPRQVARR